MPVNVFSNWRVNLCPFLKHKSGDLRHHNVKPFRTVRMAVSSWIPVAEPLCTSTNSTRSTDGLRLIGARGSLHCLGATTGALRIQWSNHELQ